MNHRLLTLACVGLTSLAIAGCKPQAPAEPPAAVASAEPTIADAPAPAATTTSVAPALDVKGFAGTFTGSGTTITLAADGGFSLKDGTAGFDGTWTAEADGAQIRLDPNSKSEPDRLYAVGGQDEIRPLDASGQPAEDGTGLQRAPSAH